MINRTQNNIIKECYTARELAELDLVDFPKSQQGIEYLAKKENWKNYPRNGRGGGRVYPLVELPADLQKAIFELVVQGSKGVNILAPIEGLSEAIPHGGKIERQTAKLMIVQYFEKYCRTTGQCVTHAEQLFLANYKLQAVQTPSDMPFSVYAEFSLATLHRWRAMAASSPETLGGKYGGRKGTSILNRANNGEVSIFIAALMSENLHYKGGHIRDMTRVKFGQLLEVGGKKVPLPSLRAFERHIVEWKTDNAQLFTSITAPGKYKNTLRVVAGDAAGSIDHLNQQWQIDASPADMICVDGRYSIYAIIDVWSRRTLFSVSKTAKTEGSLLLVRKAILEWGMPEAIKTDNGSDFISKRFKLALVSLGIEQVISPPFSPEKKAFVERVIGTMQRDLMAILPGFAGHSVADRKRIQDQKAFAARLGESGDEAFSVSMTSVELQKALDDWAAGMYGRRVHEGIGMSPMERAASSNIIVRKPKDIRALDLLLAPIAGSDGLRTVTRSGIRIDSFQYFSEEAIPFIGKTVFVRHDPSDLGRIYGFNEDSDYLFEAICPEMLGINRSVFARQLQAAQAANISEKKKEINTVRRGLDRKELADGILAMHAQSTLEAFPRPSEAFTSQALDEASRAINPTAVTPRNSDEASRMEALATRMNTPAPAVLTDKERWTLRLADLDRRLAAGEQLSELDAQWRESNSQTPWAVAYRNAQEREALAAAAHAAARGQQEAVGMEFMPAVNEQQQNHLGE